MRVYCAQEGIFVNLLKLKMTRISKNFQVNLPEPLSQLELIKTHQEDFETWRLVFIRIIYLKHVIKIDTKSQYRNTAGVVPFQHQSTGFLCCKKLCKVSLATLWKILFSLLWGLVFTPLAVLPPASLLLMPALSWLYMWDTCTPFPLFGFSSRALTVSFFPRLVCWTLGKEIFPLLTGGITIPEE